MFYCFNGLMLTVTIINDNQNRNELTFLIPMLIGALVVFAVSGIFLYNQNVNASHEISKIKNNLGAAEIKNAELKTALDLIASQEKFKDIIEKNFLTIEKNPEYVKTTDKQLTANNNL